jgi:hypothetical protein
MGNTGMHAKIVTTLVARNLYDIIRHKLTETTKSTVIRQQARTPTTTIQKQAFHYESTAGKIYTPST